MTYHVAWHGAWTCRPSLGSVWAEGRGSVSQSSTRGCMSCLGVERAGPLSRGWARFVVSWIWIGFRGEEYMERIRFFCMGMVYGCSSIVLMDLWVLVLGFLQGIIL